MEDIKIYTGVICPNYGQQVFVREGPANRCANWAPRPLNPRLDLMNHSPSGLSWGFMGSGPHQLGLAILADALGDDDAARVNYHGFTRCFISGLPEDQPWVIDDRSVAQIVAIVTALDAFLYRTESNG